jgi:hypothetical protein
MRINNIIKYYMVGMEIKWVNVCVECRRESES